MTDRLLPPRLRPYALAAVTACALVTIVLGVHYSGTTEPGRIDSNLDIRIRARLADHHYLLQHLVRLGDPEVVAAWSLLLAVLCGLLWRWRGVLLCGLGPALAGGMTDYVLKPLIGRHSEGSVAYAFPSGHTTGAFAVAVCAVVLLLDRNELSVDVRILLGVIGIGLATGTAVSLVGLGYHYTTDTIGGFCVAVGVVLALALVIDVAAERWTVRSAGTSSRAS